METVLGLKASAMVLGEMLILKTMYGNDLLSSSFRYFSHVFLLCCQWEVTEVTDRQFHCHMLEKGHMDAEGGSVLF